MEAGLQNGEGQEAHPDSFGSESVRFEQTRRFIVVCAGAVAAVAGILLAQTPAASSHPTGVGDLPMAEGESEQL